EEPSAGTHFFLVLSDARTILPTLRSRMVCIEDGHSQGTSEFGTEFLKASLSERLKLVGMIAEHKDKEKARHLVRSLIHVLREAGQGERGVLRLIPVLENLIQTDEYLSDRSPSIKMLLEH